jgi:hypothetical protein
MGAKGKGCGSAEKDLEELGNVPDDDEQLSSDGRKRRGDRIGRLDDQMKGAGDVAPDPATDGDCLCGKEGGPGARDGGTADREEGTAYRDECAAGRASVLRS